METQPVKTTTTGDNQKIVNIFAHVDADLKVINYNHLQRLYKF